MVEISVVVPVYNSADCIEELNRQVTDALQGIAHELILVDDQSTDGSWAAIQQVCGQNRAVTGLHLRKNAGQDSAILCGLRHARGRFVVIMDDDLQQSPHDIPLLHRECQARDLDVCYGHFPVKKHARWKKAGSWLSGRIAQIVLAKPRDLYLSPFKIVRGDIVPDVVRYTGAFPYVDGLLLDVTAAVGQVDVEHRERFHGNGNYSFAKSLGVFLRLATGFSVWPLRLATGTGFALAGGGLLLAVFYLVQYLTTDRHVEGWVTLVILQLLIGGVLLTSLGLVGEYLGRLYLNASGKPQSVIKDTCPPFRPQAPEDVPEHPANPPRPRPS